MCVAVGGSSSHSFEAIQKKAELFLESFQENPGVSLQVKVCAVTMAARVLVNPIVAQCSQQSGFSFWSVKFGWRGCLVICFWSPLLRVLWGLLGGLRSGDMFVVVFRNG